MKEISVGEVTNSFAAPKQNLLGPKILLVTSDRCDPSADKKKGTDWCQQGIEKVVPPYKGVRCMSRTTWKGSGMAVRLNVNSYVLVVSR